MLLMYHVGYLLSLCTQNHKGHLQASHLTINNNGVKINGLLYPLLHVSSKWVWKQVIIVHCFLKISMNKFDTLVSNWTNNHHKKKLYWILLRIMSVFYNSHLVHSISVKFLRTTSKCLFVHCITIICLFCVLLRA